MNPHFDGARCTFGSFVCLRSLPRILLDDTAEVHAPGVPSHIVIEYPVAVPSSAENARLYAQDMAYFDSDVELQIMPEFWSAGAGI